MFDRSDRLTLYINALLMAFGIIFSLFSGFYIIGLIFSGCTMLLIHDLYRQNKTEFTITHLDKVLTIQDNNGNKATEKQKYTVTANTTGLSEFWFNNINSNGIISHIHIDGARPAQQKQEEGKTQVAMKFDTPAKVGNTFVTTLTLGHQHAFLKNQETLTHTIDNKTKFLRMVVEYPASRRVGFASLSRRYQGEEIQETPPTISDHGKIVADIKNPPIGAEYCLHWDWPKAKLMTKIDSLFFNK